MILQHTPMKWPPNRPVDWVDMTERAIWLLEFQKHLFNLFVVGLESTKPSRKRYWTLERRRESVLANKQVIDQMLHLAGAALDPDAPRSIPLPSPQFQDPPEIATGWPSPFEELPAGGWSRSEHTKWVGYVENQLDYLMRLLLMAHPKGSEEHLRARWAVIRVRALFEKLPFALVLPLRQR